MRTAAAPRSPATFSHLNTFIVWFAHRRQHEAAQHRAANVLSDWTSAGYSWVLINDCWVAGGARGRAGADARPRSRHPARTLSTSYSPPGNNLFTYQNPFGADPISKYFLHRLYSPSFQSNHTQQYTIHKQQ